MSSTKPSLWPLDIQVGVQSPREAVEAQARVLRELTRGILSAEVCVINDDHEKQMTICMDLIGPNHTSRHRLLTATHSTERIYPCIVQAKTEMRYPKANTERELLDLIAQILQSGDVKALASSLIVKNRQSIPTPGHSKRQIKRSRSRSAWMGVCSDEFDSSDLAELLCDEPQGID